MAQKSTRRQPLWSTSGGRTASGSCASSCPTCTAPAAPRWCRSSAPTATASRGSTCTAAWRCWTAAPTCVGGTLYNEEVAYGDQLLFPDPETAAVVPWAESTARWICDSQWADGDPLEALPRHVFRRAAGARPSARVRAADRVRAGVLPADRATTSRCSRATRSSTSPGTRTCPFIQELVEQLNAVRHRGDHRQLRVRRVAVGDPLPARPRHGRPRPLLLVQERGQGAGPPARLHGHLHVQAVRRLGRVGHAHPHQPADRTTTVAMHSATTPIRPASPAPAGSFIAGQLAHAAGVYALLAPTVNCLKRRRTAHLQPDQRLVGPRGPLGARPHQGRLDRRRGTSSTARRPAWPTPIWWPPACWQPAWTGSSDGLSLEPAAQPPAEEDRVAAAAAHHRCASRWRRWRRTHR